VRDVRVDDVRVTLCGVRGSTPSPGPEHVRYGGHTSCVAVAHDGASPTLVLDGGTGLRRLSRLLGEAPFSGSVVLGHLHWDHVMGLPFFRSGALPAARVDVLGPDEGDGLEALLERMMSPPLFPVSPAQLGPGWTFSALTAGRREVEGFTVTALDIPHKGGRTLGLRVEDGTSSLAYLSDHDPRVLGAGPQGTGALHPAALALAGGVDLLLHDAQVVQEELPRLGYLGHAAAEYAVCLAEAAGARRLVLFHHAPDRADDALDALAARFRVGSVDVTVAVEGAVVDLPIAPRPLAGADRLAALAPGA
jgi:phosphoribosyl 1,2-cyclic phosphodiesterase